jgi:sirohydrochlorin ferrochelatase
MNARGTAAGRAVLLVAHGSRRDESNEEVRALAERVRACLVDDPRIVHVGCAFLELTEPDIGAGIDACVAAGAGEVVVLPYFLAAGRHVQTDIPAAVAAARRAHHRVRILLGPHLGAHEALAGLLAEAGRRGLD